jgi:dCMP deaminase
MLLVSKAEVCTSAFLFRNFNSILNMFVARYNGSMKKSPKIRSEKYVRPSWDQYFMNIAELVGSRATCGRGRSGSVIARDRRILVTGYVGSPAGLPHCDEAGHEMSKVIHDDGTESEHCIRTIHAEQNAIAQAAQIGVSIQGATLYCHMTPCYTCAKIIINSGIQRVVANLDYHRAQKTKEVFKKSGVKFDLLHKKIEDYKADIKK